MVYAKIIQRDEPFLPQYDISMLDERMADKLHHMPEKVVTDVSAMVIAPMPGLVKSVAVSPGDMVRKVYLPY